jgi:hypothetical protein
LIVINISGCLAGLKEENMGRTCESTPRPGPKLQIEEVSRERERVSEREKERERRTCLAGIVTPL